MTEPKWLSRESAYAIHGLSVARFGGGDGLRNPHALEKSLVRPLQHSSYGDSAPGIFKLAAIYCSGIVRSSLGSSMRAAGARVK